ncbi:ATP-dependent zinc metalloprotease FTSH chloroplastic [Bienertia sinuspersici]
MAASKDLPSTLTTLLFIFLLLLSSFTFSASSIAGTTRVLQAETNQQQTNNNTHKNQIPNCSDLIEQTHCDSLPKCRWCRSNFLDSMCTTKSEAWRLPSLVFVCD